MSVLSRLLPMLAAGLWLLAGCGAPAPTESFKATDVTGADFGRGFDLVDHNDRRRRLEDFRGKVVVLFFGYTHCPDVCPTTLGDLKRTLELLDAQAAARVQILLVTVDPGRDAAATLKDYLSRFHPGFLGLRGTPEELEKTAKEFKASFHEHTEPGGGSHIMNHSAGSYVLDARGRLRLFVPYGQTPEDIAHDLRVLLAEG